MAQVGVAEQLEEPVVGVTAWSVSLFAARVLYVPLHERRLYPAITRSCWHLMARVKCGLQF